MLICTLGGAMSSNLEMKMNDALFGLAPNFALPCTKKFDGKKLTFEFAKSFNDLKLAVDTTFTPSSGALGNVVKADYNANGITAGVKASVDNVAAASFHITTAVKNQVVGVKGALNNPTALSLVYAPSSCLTVNTDMTKYDISYHLVSTLTYFKYFKLTSISHKLTQYFVEGRFSSSWSPMGMDHGIRQCQFWFCCQEDSCQWS